MFFKLLLAKLRIKNEKAPFREPFLKFVLEIVLEDIAFLPCEIAVEKLLCVLLVIEEPLHVGVCYFGVQLSDDDLCEVLLPRIFADVCIVELLNVLFVKEPHELLVCLFLLVIERPPLHDLVELLL